MSKPDGICNPRHYDCLACNLASSFYSTLSQSPESEGFTYPLSGTLNGGIGNDTLIGGAGANILNGGGGFDKATYAVASTAVTITHNSNGSVTIVGNDFSDTLTGIENAVFTDKSVSLRERNRSDFTGNGTSDLVLQSGGTVVDWIIGNSAFQSGGIVGSYIPGWDVVGTGDYNGDGIADISLQNGSTLVGWNMANGLIAGGGILGTTGGYGVRG